MEKKGEGCVEEYGAYHCSFDKLGSGREWRGTTLIGLEQRRDRM